ncbi:MAG: DotU family type IV/VI secretion system protein, partial [Acidobacteria bacterium]|nr:DotU family type IV/VI secretion system protein [Acidobacteriota bacterium]
MGETIVATASMRSGDTGKRKRENLGLIYQEVMTAITRLRANRQNVDDAQVFRTHLRSALSAAEQDALGAGYAPEDVRLSTFAVVAFLDESALNSGNAVFAEWPRLPLQEEMFGHHMAGEIFFQNIEKLLSRTDVNSTADVLELYQLCLLLGYKGRYSLAGVELLRPIMDGVAEKIRRIRGASKELSPGWAAPKDAVIVSAPDTWVKRLIFITIGCVVLAGVLFLAYKLVL